MDGNRFDALARSFASSQTRRGLLGGSAGALLAAVAPGRWGVAAGRRLPGQICRTSGDCASGICGPKDNTGRRRCSCGAASDCPVPSNACLAATCVSGVCQTAPRTGEACDDRNACTTNSTCDAQGGCVGTPVVCTALDQCHDDGVCDPSTGACSNPPKSNGTPCNDGDACSEGDTCLNGVCQGGTAKTCPICQACSGGACQPSATDVRCDGVCSGGACLPACLDVQALCDPSDNQCCNGRCEDVRTCGGEGAPQCCFSVQSPCSTTCDCCDPYSCVRGQCCGNFLNLPCDDQRICCDGWQCLNGTCQLATCLPAGEVCEPENPNCCEDQAVNCQAATGACGGGTRCCHPSGGSCADTCDCCSGLICFGGECCIGERQACTSSSDCCAPMSCRGGLCLFDCPLGGFPCGATCCASFEHCQNGTSCDCIPIQGQCDPNNNLCCQNGETLCPDSNPYGNARTCCKPQGGTCASDRDCYFEIYETLGGRGTCGDDSICGGAGAYCNTADDCVAGRSCVGACFGKGLGFVLCESDSECPNDVDGNATFCRQMRCVYPNELPD